MKTIKIQEDVIINDSILLEKGDVIEVMNEAVSYRQNELKKGMKFTWVTPRGPNRGNKGDWEILGFTDDKSEGGENPERVFNSVKDLLNAYSVKSLKALQSLQDENRGRHHSYMIVKDLKTNKSGPWLYLYNGRWSSGSGADPVDFYPENY